MDSGKAERELEWAPAYPSWRDGFRALAAALGDASRSKGRATGQ
jgi:hypothetical protein